MNIYDLYEFRESYIEKKIIFQYYQRIIFVSLKVFENINYRAQFSIPISMNLSRFRHVFLLKIPSLT